MNRDTVSTHTHSHGSQHVWCLRWCSFSAPLVNRLCLLLCLLNTPSPLLIIHRSPKNWSISTTLRTSRLWMCLGLPVKTAPSRCWMSSTKRYEMMGEKIITFFFFFFGPAALFLKWQGTEILLTSCSCVFFLVQLDCCGKGDDTALFLQLATTLCPTKSPEDFQLRSQVCTNLLLSSHSFSICN